MGLLFDRTAMTLHLQLTPAQAFALRDALASAARHPDYDYDLDPIWDLVGEYCERRTHHSPPLPTSIP